MSRHADGTKQSIKVAYMDIKGSCEGYIYAYGVSEVVHFLLIKVDLEAANSRNFSKLRILQIFTICSQ